MPLVPLAREIGEHTTRPVRQQLRTTAFGPIAEEEGVGGVSWGCCLVRFGERSPPFISNSKLLDAFRRTVKTNRSRFIDRRATAPTEGGRCSEAGVPCLFRSSFTWSNLSVSRPRGNRPGTRVVEINRTISQDDFGFLTCLTLLVLTVPAFSRVPSIVCCGVRGSPSSSFF